MKFVSLCHNKHTDITGDGRLSRATTNFMVFTLFTKGLLSESCLQKLSGKTNLLTYFSKICFTEFNIIVERKTTTCNSIRF